MTQTDGTRTSWLKSPFAWTVIGGSAGVVAAIVAIAAYANDLSDPPVPPVTSTAQAAPSTGAVLPPSTTEPTTTDPTTDPPTLLPSTAGPSTDRYLMDLEALREPYGDDGPTTMRRTTYERSVHTYCGKSSLTDPQVWQVEPGYSRFRAVVGIPDNDRNAGGKIAQYSFRDENGTDLIESFGIRLGQVREVDFDLRGAVQLQIVCVAKSASTNELAARFKGGLGDARFTGES